ncbi:MAG TPA: MBL fold metallo-hydrolase [Chloroflexi bacterium]|jgi:hydroxyacylglutathione hydrolase|nr:MBL fold metallo-hydrolase [Chloroflexota bacterium]
MILRTLIVGVIKTNCYIMACERTREAMIIDPGGDAEKIIQAVQEMDVKVRRIVLTHFHFDHTLAAEDVRTATDARLAVHRAEVPYLEEPPEIFRTFSPEASQGISPDMLLDEGVHVQIGELDFEVLHTPGHSPGSLSLWIPNEGAVFSGDVLFRSGVGRTDLPGSDYKTLFYTVRDKLFALPDETFVYPGHGSRTTIGYERQNNPWVGVNAEWPV